MTAPSLAVFMICKNEAAHIGKALASVAPVASVAVVVDTGSTDQTREVALGCATNGFAVEWSEYHDASERDETGNWVLWDFAAARNHAAELAESSGCSRVMWLDADDVLEQPERVARAIYRDDVDVIAMTIDSGGMRWLHHRLWRTSARVRFRGRCHEYPIIDGLHCIHLNATIKHDSAPGAGQENSNARNLRMLLREWSEHPDDARTAFYLAQTHKDAGRHADAAQWYERRIALGEHYRDEWVFAHLYLAREYARLERHDDARRTLETGRKLAPDWAEFSTDLARLALHRKEPNAPAFALQSFDQPIPPTDLWRESNAYRDQPCRIMSWAREREGKIGDAYAWSRMALDRIGEPDKEWQDRIAHLERELVKTSTSKPGKSIAIVRPGAIGDVLMTLNCLPEFIEQFPDVDVHYYTAVVGLDDVIRAAGAIPRPFGDFAAASLAGSHSRIFNLVGYPLREGYPHKPMALHLLSYFRSELLLSTLRDHLPALELPLPPRPRGLPLGDYATWQPAAGWSKYKQWPRERWLEVFKSLPFPIVELSEQNTPELSAAIATFAHARVHLGVDSFANHLTNYFWRDGNSARRVPGVILWGSTQVSAAGYEHNVNLSAGLPCQPCFRENPAVSAMPRGPCINPPRASYDDDTPHACMQAISVDEVISAALGLWDMDRSAGFVPDDA